MRRFLKRIGQRLKQRLFRQRTVDFIVCGVQKGGTSALFAYLREHPEICMPDVKEVHYFDNERNFAPGPPDYDQYRAHFLPTKHHTRLGEATPITMYWEPAPQRIRAYNPAMKLIALLRNPIERAYSHWNMERSRNAEQLSFWDAIANEPERCREAYPLQHRVYSYIDRGFYGKQLQRLWSHLPKEAVLVLKSEDLKRSPVETLGRVCDFLQVSRFAAIANREANALPYRSPLGEKEKQYLKAIFEPEIKALERELDWDCREWLEC